MPISDVDLGTGSKIEGSIGFKKVVSFWSIILCRGRFLEQGYAKLQHDTFSVRMGSKFKCTDGEGGEGGK